MSDAGTPTALYMLWSDKFYSSNAITRSDFLSGDDLSIFMSEAKAEALVKFKNDQGLGGGVGDWRVVAYGRRRKRR